MTEEHGSTLEVLAAENSSLKEEIEFRLNELAEYKSIIEDYSEKIETQMQTTETLQSSLSSSQHQSLLSNFTGSKNNQSKVQDLVKDLSF